MRVRSLGALSVGILLTIGSAQLKLSPTSLRAQAPPRDRAADVPTGTARLRGRVVAADAGTPLRRAQVRAVASAIRTTRLTSTDAEGRYEFSNLPAGRYTIRVNKAGYVGLEFGQHRPFESGRPLDVSDGQIVEQIDFALPRGSVITGRLTDDGGDPIVGAWVQAMRYQYGPGGRRRLVQVDSQSWNSNTTNDLGEFRLFGLMPGTYVVSAQSESTGVVGLAQAGSQTGGITSVDVREGFLQTYFPGTGNVAEALPVVVNLSEEAQVSFSLATGRKSNISGNARRSDGGVAAGSTLNLSRLDTNGEAIGGWGNSNIAADGSFSLANVPPGQYVLEVEPARQALDVVSGRLMRQGSDPGQTPESARMPIAVGGGDITGVVITTRPGISVSGRVSIQSATFTKISEPSSLRMNAVSTNPVEAERTAAIFQPNNGVIESSGQFEIRGISGQVLFRPFPLPNNLVLKSVSLDGVDITDRPYDTVQGRPQRSGSARC